MRPTLAHATATSIPSPPTSWPSPNFTVEDILPGEVSGRPFQDLNLHFQAPLIPTQTQRVLLSRLVNAEAESPASSTSACSAHRRRHDSEIPRSLGQLSDRFRPFTSKRDRSTTELRRVRSRHNNILPGGQRPPQVRCPCYGGKLRQANRNANHSRPAPGHQSSRRRRGADTAPTGLDRQEWPVPAPDTAPTPWPTTGTTRNHVPRRTPPHAHALKRHSAAPLIAPTPDPGRPRSARTRRPRGTHARSCDLGRDRIRLTIGSKKLSDSVG